MFGRAFGVLKLKEQFKFDIYKLIQVPLDHTFQECYRHQTLLGQNMTIVGVLNMFE